MAPGLQSRDLAVIRPAEEFNGEGLYPVSLLGSEMLRRVFQTADGKYTANCDKRDHYPGYSAVERLLAWSGRRACKPCLANLLGIERPGSGAQQPHRVQITN